MALPVEAPVLSPALIASLSRGEVRFQALQRRSTGSGRCASDPGAWQWPNASPHSCCHRLPPLPPPPDVPLFASLRLQVVVSDVGPTVPGVTAVNTPRFLLELARAAAGALPLLRQGSGPRHRRPRCWAALPMPLCPRYVDHAPECCGCDISPFLRSPSAGGSLQADKVVLAVRASGITATAEALGEGLADALWCAAAVPQYCCLAGHGRRRGSLLAYVCMACASAASSPALHHRVQSPAGMRGRRWRMRRAAGTPRHAWPTWRKMHSRRRWCVAVLSLHAVAVAVAAVAGRTAPRVLHECLRCIAVLTEVAALSICVVFSLRRHRHQHTHAPTPPAAAQVTKQQLFCVGDGEFFEECGLVVNRELWRKREIRSHTKHVYQQRK